MTNSRGFTMSGRTIGLMAVSIAMIFVSIYMTQHFFEVRYPTGLSSGSICNINEFFNCDKVTNSAMAAPFNVPTSVLGGIIGLLLLLGTFLKSEKFQNTLYAILILNFAGCLGLFLYSLFNLGSICIFCSLYYVLSGVALFLYYKSKAKPVPDLMVLAGSAVLLGIVAFSVRSTVVSKNAELERADSLLTESVRREYALLEKINFDNSKAPNKLNMVANAPLQMIIFSDFECPACRMLSEQIPQILADFKDKIDISYYYYPLDQTCNVNVHRAMHLHACKAAAAAICLPNVNFYDLHETFFKNQDSFRGGFVENFITENKIDDCVSNSATQDRLKQIIQMAEPIHISSTPTFLLNGAKFEGAVPYYKLKIILESLAKKPNP